MTFSRLKELGVELGRSIFTPNISLSYIKNYLPSNPVILEAGAHRGEDSARMAKQWPKGDVYSFEPIPKLYEGLCKLKKNYPNIHFFNVALDEECEYKTFYKTQHKFYILDGMSSFLKPPNKFNHKHFIHEKIIVETVTIDRWCKENFLQKVDFLWLDIEGYELKVLKKAIHTLKSVKAIHIELSKGSSVRPGATPDRDIINFLESQDFIMIYKKTVPLLTSYVGIYNALFIKNDNNASL